MRFAKFSIAVEIKKALEEKGFHKTTDIQFKAIPAIQKGSDVLAIAQTGTGKTAAFAIPVIDKIFRMKRTARKRGVRCLVMVPTRELAVQIMHEFQSIAKYTSVKAFALIGGVEQDPQIAKLNMGVDVLIVTPGRLFDLIHQEYVDLSLVNTLILDEADLMLDLGFYKDIQDVLRHLKKNKVQTLFFSATIDKKIKKLAYSLVKRPIRIELSPKDPVSKNIDHWKVHVEQDDKRFFLERLIRENKEAKVIVFVRTRVRSVRVQKAMGRVDIAALVINGEMEQQERNEVLRQFRKGSCLVLIATDVTARGIDIPNVEIVVNYDLPEDPEYYVHRIGRTGRGRNRGIAYSFFNEIEREVLNDIEAYVGNPIQTMVLDEGFYKEIKYVPNEEQASMDDIMKLINDNEQFKNKSKKK